MKLLTHMSDHVDLVAAEPPSQPWLIVEIEDIFRTTHGVAASVCPEDVQIPI